ncbi:MAG: hypothetical protein GWP08_01700 [Nitrospiraceae bacterium]|nr:hypothetical protein [Nitrospiraceae bacterium]
MTRTGARFFASTVLAVLVCLWAIAPVCAHAADAGPPKPWTLRDKYVFNSGKAALEFSIEEGEWRLTAEGVGQVIDDASFLITFADGTALRSTDLGKGEAGREPFSDEYGGGTRFWAEFPPKDGLVVRHTVTTHKNWPFFLLQLSVTNTGDSPVEIAKITPAQVGPAGIHGLSGQASAGSRHVSARGSFPVFTPDAPPLLTIVSDPAHDLSFAVGLLPLGVAEPAALFQRSGDAWQGEIACRYTPALRIGPGEKLASDPVWVCMGTLKPSELDMFHGWVTSLRPRPEANSEAPLSWVTIDSQQGAVALYKAAGDWRSAGVSYALVPNAWEGRPGSLAGAVPRYPRNMSKVAQTLDALGIKAGLTVDPLLVTGGDAAFTATSPDGRTWANLATPKGRKFAVERMSKTAGWGFDFWVIHPSDIPDAVLKYFNMTRVQADMLAFAVMSEAADGQPVLPSASATLAPEALQWLEAAAASSRMAEYGVVPGPIRLAVLGREPLDPALLAAMRFFNGPIEFAGSATTAQRRDLGRLLALPRFTGRPVDATQRAPRIWQIPVSDQDGEPLGDAVVSFPGARPWGRTEVEARGGRDVRVWRADNGAFLAAEEKTAPASDTITIYGAAPQSDHPILLGASGGLDLLLGDLKHVTWTPGSGGGTLTGLFQGRHLKSATAYVAIPPGWTLKSGKAAGGSIRKKDVTDRATFSVKAGVSTPFDLEFIRN